MLQLPENFRFLLQPLQDLDRAFYLSETRCSIRRSFAHSLNARSNLTQFRRLSNFAKTFNKVPHSLESLHHSRPDSHLRQQISIVNVNVGGYVGNF